MGHHHADQLEKHDVVLQVQYPAHAAVRRRLDHQHLLRSPVDRATQPQAGLGRLFHCEGRGERPDPISGGRAGGRQHPRQLRRRWDGRYPLVPEYGEEVREKRRLAIPLQTTGTGWDVAWAAVYLASDESRWVTGVELPIDAGQMRILDRPR